ncbi:MAG: zinc ribbon domain-containing protein [Herminiimonas sp.]|nr:zinc ribbon domain-containing protein [Herminiimonas sp.]
MSYEYSSESRSLDFPNPFKVENLFRFVGGLILLAGGFLLLMVSRGNLAGSLSLWSAAPLLTGVFLLVFGIFYIAKVMTQLRFFFGRGEPRGLGQELSADTGTGDKYSAGLKETMRQNALTFEEPRGALNGLLYTLLPRLIFAPLRLQGMAQRQFHTALAMAVTLLSLLVAWVGFGASRQSGWLGLFYFLFAGFLMLRPLEDGDLAKADLNIRGLVALILVAIFGPVLVPFVANRLPDIGWLSLNGQTFFLLIAAMGAVMLFFMALTKQLVAPPATTMGCETETLSFNAHPKQVLDELDRELQRNWVEKVPNRRYIKILPVLGSGSGVFSGESLEETQPFAPSTQPRIDLATCLREPRYQWLTFLNVLGLVLMAVAVGALVTFGMSIKPDTMERSVFAYATFGAAMLLVAHFCFKAGHLLWARFDFLSEVVWVEMKGNYTSAKFDYGNQFTDHVKTQKDIINIETMTLRVWVAQIESVTFGKGTERSVIGMRGLPDKARYLCGHLSAFAGNQSMIIAPSSTADMQKVAALSAINQFSARNTDGAATPAALLEKMGAPSALAARVAAAGAPRVCPACATVNDAEARFCTNCGSAIGTA